MYIGRCLLLAMLIGGFSLLVHAQQAVNSHIVNVALFKQGYGCIVREVTLPAGEHEAVIADMPVPVHGTFWILTPPAIALRAAIATKGERRQAVAAVTLPELLRRNRGNG